MTKQYLCLVCSKDCKTDCIYCEVCKTWSHNECEDIDFNLQKQWSQTNSPYICRKCRCHEDGSFNFVKGLVRLEKAASQGIKRLKNVCDREHLFVKCHPVDSSLKQDFSQIQQDTVSNNILNRHHCNRKIAIGTTGDGDCLFNAVSIYLCKSENKSVELRYRCCIEMVTNKQKVTRHNLTPKFELLSPDYDRDCLNCAKRYSYSPVWRIIALSNLLNIQIECVYPMINGSRHVAFQTLNIKFKPPFCDPDDGIITIMWTSTQVPKDNVIVNGRIKSGKEWTPNHFVPLVEMTTRRICDAMSECPKFPEMLEKPEIVNTTRVTTTDKKYDDLSVIYEEGNESDTECEQPEHENENINNLSISSCNDDTINDSSTSLEETVTEEELKPIFVPGKLKKFMDINETMKLFQSPYTVLGEIPTQRKDGMFFIIDNQQNLENKENGGKVDFWDNSGAWNKASCPKQCFLPVDTKLVSIVKREGLYCTEKSVKKKRQYIPLHPQPDERNVLIVKRVYQTLKASTRGPHMFQRRITWFDFIPSSLEYLTNTVAVAEYIGSFPDRQYHGNVKLPSDNMPYIKTKPSVMQELKELLQTEKTTTVEAKMNRKTQDENEKMRNLTQLKNMKYNQDKTKRKECGTMGNEADHIIAVEEMTKTHEFVQSVKHLKHANNPVITLYTDQQIVDLKRFCGKDQGTVIGIDKTYNLGEFHVTPTVYKDLSVLRRSTNDHPICFGPTFIHTSSTTKTYSTFLHEIADNLTEDEIRNITIGSDEEASFKASIKRCFSGCTHVLCTRHLKQNANKYMEDNVGYPLNDRQHILKGIFEQDGIVYSKDADTLDTRVSRITQFIKEKDKATTGKSFLPYFENKMMPLLKQHVIEPSKAGKIKPNWTNNNSESANHILKSTADWKLQNIPTFIKNLYEKVESEKIERCRAIRNRGNYKLDAAFNHHYIDIDSWTNLNQEQRDSKENKFLSDKGRSGKPTIISSDGQRTLIKTPTAGKKPNQIKRKRAERSRTPTAKRRIISN